MIVALVQRLPETNFITLSLGAVSLLVLLFFHLVLGKWLKRWKAPQGLTSFATKGGPLVAVLITSLVVWSFGLSENAGVSVAGHIPSGLPSLSLPSFDLVQWKQLAVAALVISFVSFLESVSVAKSLAAKRRQKVDANQELIALGAANMAAAFTCGYPVAGSFSRSVVNFSAGANTGLASMITAMLIGLSVLFLCCKYVA